MIKRETWPWRSSHRSFMDVKCATIKQVKYPCKRGWEGFHRASAGNGLLWTQPQRCQGERYRVTTGGATTRNELGWKRVSFKRKWVTAVTTKTKLVLVPKNLTCCFSCPEHPSQMMGSKYSLFSFGGVEETHRMGVSAKGQGIVVNENV